MTSQLRILQRLCSRCRSVSRVYSSDAAKLQPSTSSRVEKKKTVFLPRTSFVNHVKSSDRGLLDQQLASAGG